MWGRQAPGPLTRELKKAAGVTYGATKLRILYYELKISLRRDQRPSVSLKIIEKARYPIPLDLRKYWVSKKKGRGSGWGWTLVQRMNVTCRKENRKRILGYFPEIF